MPYEIKLSVMYCVSTRERLCAGYFERVLRYVQVALDYSQVEAAELRAKVQAKDAEIVVSFGSRMGQLEPGERHFS